jgi:hypothetical protein
MWQVELELENDEDVVLDTTACTTTIEDQGEFVSVTVMPHTHLVVNNHRLLLVVKHLNEKGHLLARHACTVSAHLHNHGPYDVFRDEALLPMTDVEGCTDSWASYTVGLPRRFTKAVAHIVT